MTESHTGAWVICHYMRVDLCSETDKARDPPLPTSKYLRLNREGLTRLVAFQ